MPRFQITAPDGRVVTVEGETAPTEKDAADIFASLPAKNANFDPPRTLSNASDILQREKGTARAKTGIQAPKGSRDTGLRDFPLQVQDIATEAIPATAGMLIGGPPLAMILGGMGNTAVQARRMAAQEQEGFKPGQLLASSLVSAIPGGQVEGTSARVLAREAVKQGAAGLTAKTAETAIDEARLPTVGEALASTAIPAAGGALAQRIGSKAPDTLNPTKRATLEAAKKEGFVVTPSSVSDSAINRQLEGVAGKAAISQAASKQNQETTTRLAKKALGIPEKTDITETVLEDIRRDAATPYAEIEKMASSARTRLDAVKEKLPTGGRGSALPDEQALKIADPVAKLEMESLMVQAAADIDALRTARNTAKTNYLHYAKTGTPSALETAEAAQELATQLEGKIEKAAIEFGTPDLVERLRASRTKIAKSYDVENALNLGDSSVSARVLARALNNGRPLTGELETIAKFTEAFPSVMREGAGVPTPGVSKVQAGMVPILAALGYGATHSPIASAAAGAIPLMSGPARSLVLSRPYQALATSVPFAMPNTALVARVLAQEAGQEVTRDKK